MSFITENKKENTDLQHQTIIDKILTIQNNINEIISLKSIFNIGKEQILKKIDTQNNSYYISKVHIKEIFDTYEIENPVFYTLKKDPKDYLKDNYQSTYNFYFLIRNDNSLMLDLIELSKKSFYENLSDFFVNYLYDNIINISFVEEKLIMMIYLLLEKLILNKLPHNIDENNRNVPALYLKDTFLSYAFKHLTRKIDMRNFLNKILRDTILKIDEYKMILSVDMAVVNKFLKFNNNKYLNKNATTKKEILQKKKKHYKPIINKNILSKNSGNKDFNRQTPIIIENDGHFLDNLEISEEIETKKEKEKEKGKKEKGKKEKGKEKKIKKEKGKKNIKEKENEIENKKEKQFQKRTTGNITNENNTEIDSLNQEKNMNNNIIYNTITENINERKDDLDLGKSNSSNVKKKENNKEILINASVIKGGDNIYNFFKDNSVTILTVENRLKK